MDLGILRYLRVARWTYSSVIRTNNEIYAIKMLRDIIVNYKSSTSVEFYTKV